MSVKVIEDEELVAEEVEADQYLVFTAQSQELGFQAMRVQEISQVLPVSHVPNAPPYIEGIMNLRGRIASVINFRKKFGFEPKEHDEDTRVIVVELDGYPIGITVDSVEEVVKIPDSSVQELPESTSTAESEEYIAGIGMLDKRLIILLDLDKVLTGTALVNVDELNQTISKIQTVEMPEPDTTQSDAAQSSELVTDNMQTAKKSEKMKADILDTKPPVDTGKKQQKKGGQDNVDSINSR
ncbi:chemotaxis protein CheW [Chloroflexota bacterium]